VIVRPETVIEWQRRRFKRYWWKLSQPKPPGRPRVSAEIRALVRNMAAANPLWGAPRVHGELLKLGIEISERTVSRLDAAAAGAVTDVESVPGQPCRTSGVGGFLHRADIPIPDPVRLSRTRS